MELKILEKVFNMPSFLLFKGINPSKLFKIWEKYDIMRKFSFDAGVCERPLKELYDTYSQEDLEDLQDCVNEVEEKYGTILTEEELGKIITRDDYEKMVEIVIEDELDRLFHGESDDDEEDYY